MKFPLGSVSNPNVMTLYEIILINTQPTTLYLVVPFLFGSKSCEKKRRASNGFRFTAPEGRFACGLLEATWKPSRSYVSVRAKSVPQKILIRSGNVRNEFFRILKKRPKIGFESNWPKMDFVRGHFPAILRMRRRKTPGPTGPQARAIAWKARQPGGGGGRNHSRIRGKGERAGAFGTCITQDNSPNCQMTLFIIWSNLTLMNLSASPPAELRLAFGTPCIANELADHAADLFRQVRLVLLLIKNAGTSYSATVTSDEGYVTKVNDKNIISLSLLIAHYKLSR